MEQQWALPQLGTVEIQCGDVRFIARGDVARIQRALAVLQRGKFWWWDYLTPEFRAQCQSDFEWLMTLADKAKMEQKRG